MLTIFQQSQSKKRYFLPKGESSPWALKIMHEV